MAWGPRFRVLGIRPLGLEPGPRIRILFGAGIKPSRTVCVREGVIPDHGGLPWNPRTLEEH